MQWIAGFLMIVDKRKQSKHKWPISKNACATEAKHHLKGTHAANNELGRNNVKKLQPGSNFQRFRCQARETAYIPRLDG